MSYTLTYLLLSPLLRDTFLLVSPRIPNILQRTRIDRIKQTFFYPSQLWLLLLFDVYDTN